jgi:hypothetical protein
MEVISPLLFTQVANHPEGAVLAQSCPRCQHSNGRWLKFTSDCNDANYFQCQACGHMWTAPKLASQPRPKTKSL